MPGLSLVARARATSMAPRSASSSSIPATNSAIAPFPSRRWPRSKSSAASILARHPIPRAPCRSAIPTWRRLRKQDPGELFDWPRLARAGIGLWPEPAGGPAPPETSPTLQRLLAAIGYRMPAERRARRRDAAVVDGVPAPFPARRAATALSMRRRGSAIAAVAALLRGFDFAASARLICRCQTAGWPPSASAGGGKSGLHGSTVPGNARRGRPQGKCHRNIPPTCRLRRRAARVKWCGKSAPRRRQRRRQGKPHREQDQVGTAGPSSPWI